MNVFRVVRVSAGCVITAICLTVVSGVCAQADQPTLDDLLNLTPEETQVVPGEESTAPADPIDPDTSETQNDLNDEIERALSVSDAVDAFEQAVNEMDDVSRRLGRALDPGIETQRAQESILRKLDQVIEAAQDQSSSGGGSSSGKPRDQDQGSKDLAQQQAGAGGQQAQPGGAQASTGAAGTGTPINPETEDTPIEQLRKEWGELPPRVREELSDGLRERFSPLYRSMTEAYYKALAEQE